MTSELQAAAAAIAEREKTINCSSLSASQMLGEAETADTLQALLEAERAKVKKLREALEYLLEHVDLPPEANCSCHVNPPCHDCVDYGGLREALELSKAALKEKAGEK